MPGRKPSPQAIISTVRENPDIEGKHPNSSPPLSPGILESLEAVWEAWAAEPQNIAKKIARARAHLVFLLIRHGGLRLGEALDFDPAAQLDRESGLLKIPGPNARDIFLPVKAMRALRRILSLPEAAEKGFSRLDPGFIRRTFYALARAAGLDSATGGPRAIRYARGLELLRLHMPLETLRNFLGLRKPGQIAAFLQFGGSLPGASSPGGMKSQKGMPENSLLGMVQGSMPGRNSVSVELKTFSGLQLISVCSIDHFMRLEPAPGQIMRAAISPERLVPLPANAPALFSNFFTARVFSIHEEKIESLAILELAEGTRLAAKVETARLENFPIKENQEISLGFSGYAVQLLPERNFLLPTI